MSYNLQELPKYINTAGKITVLTALLSVVVFAVAFLLNIGAKELQKVDAQGQVATTTVVVLNTPPQWTVDAQEEVESSTSSPTNSGDEVAWVATGTDSNSEDYFLLICSDASTPSSTPGAPPTCNSPITWAVSATTTSGSQARAATTTTETSQFFPGEENDWYAWICDAVDPGARCNAASRQGTGTTSSPFNVNRRPTFISYFDNSELITAVPGDTVTFYATSSDPDTVDTNDTMKLIVCSTPSYSTSTATCNDTTLASSSFSTTMPLTADYTVFTPTPDDTYGAYGFIIDEHLHVAATTTQNTVLTVNNVAPNLTAGGGIVLNGGNPLVLTQEAGETTGFTLSFTVTDNNSCETSVGGDEITGYEVSVFRSGIGSTTCDGSGTNYDPNNCYDSGVATTTWNLSCTASTTSCTYDGIVDFDTSYVFDCTFPLWYVADPTNGTSTQTFYFDERWSAGVAGVDDDFATGTMGTTSNPVELNSFLIFSLDTVAIPYGPLEPGQRTDPLSASTTLRATGNIGLDEKLSGQHMCDYYTSAVTCLSSATSTIADQYQVFSTSVVTYGTATTAGNTLSSSTLKELEINILKPTSTATQTTGVTYWGIEVPATITKAGTYTGENTIWGVSGEPAEWY